VVEATGGATGSADTSIVQIADVGKDWADSSRAIARRSPAIDAARSTGRINVVRARATLYNSF